ncbi:MAG: amino acid racemase [Candidatus Methanoperedens sp.]|nr:amino acid racemase [Candidatus Methanoperedens sp.]MCZ7405271.1 amino acid racemase [Candidatus Methanoperedens sp.]
MKRIGIIGGLGPESTIDYYKGIINIFRQRESGLAAPEIIIYSADVNRLLELAEAREWNKLVEWLVEMVNALHNAGAEFAVIGSNTPHIVFDKVKSRSPIPMLSIVDETCKRASNMKLKKLGLMGTKFTMESDFFQKAFHDAGISIIVPMKDEQQFIYNKIISEIGLGIIKNSTRQELLSIAKRMIEEDSIDGLILGCTELPLILEKDEYGIPFLNTTAIHIDSIVDYCIGN